MNENDIKDLKNEITSIQKAQKKFAVFIVVFIVVLLLLEILFITAKTPLTEQLFIGVIGAVIGSISTHFFNRCLDEKRQEAICMAALLQTHAALGIQMEEITSVNSIVNNLNSESKLKKFSSERLGSSKIDLPYQIFISKKLKKKLRKLFAYKSYMLIKELSRCDRICLEIKFLIDGRDEVHTILMQMPPTNEQEEQEAYKTLAHLTEEMCENIKSKIGVYLKITPNLFSLMEEGIKIFDSSYLPLIEKDVNGNPIIDLLPSNT
jgi:hypothetical protein